MKIDNSKIIIKSSTKTITETKKLNHTTENILYNLDHYKPEGYKSTISINLDKILMLWDDDKGRLTASFEFDNHLTCCRFTYINQKEVIDYIKENQRWYFK